MLTQNFATQISIPKNTKKIHPKKFQTTNFEHKCFHTMLNLKKTQVTHFEGKKVKQHRFFLTQSCENVYEFCFVCVKCIYYKYIT